MCRTSATNFKLAQANRVVGGIETVFIMTGDQYALTSSSLIRQVVALGGDLNRLSAVLPPLVIKRLGECQRTGRLGVGLVDSSIADSP